MAAFTYLKNDLGLWLIQNGKLKSCRCIRNLTYAHARTHAQARTRVRACVLTQTRGCQREGISINLLKIGEQERLDCS
jgi:hypothetical protein